MTLRKLIALIALGILVLLAVAQFGPSLLLGEEASAQLRRPAPEFAGFPPG